MMSDSRKFVFINIIFITACMLFLSGCTRGSETAAPTTEANKPSPTTYVKPTRTLEVTLTSPTVETHTLNQFPTDMPPIIVEQPTPAGTPEPVYAFEGRKILPAQIQIRLPGEGSRVVSPLSVKIMLYPGDSGKVLVQLFGEDGRLMAEQLKSVFVPETGWVELLAEIPFEISSAGEVALLVVSTTDGYDRRIAQTSVPLVLLQVGSSEIEQPGFLKDPFYFDTPVFKEVIKNGMIHVSGFLHPFGSGTITADLVAANGAVLKTILYQLPKITIDQEFIPFAMDIPYTVDKRTPVLLRLRQVDERLPLVDVSLKSLLIYLDP